VVRRDSQLTTWNYFAAEWERVAGSTAGSAVARVTGRIVAPTTLARIEALRTRFAKLRWYRYEPVNDNMARVRSSPSAVS
jgi:hypothetical protein